MQVIPRHHMPGPTGAGLAQGGAIIALETGFLQSMFHELTSIYQESRQTGTGDFFWKDNVSSQVTFVP
jgi:hypothetical protein